MKRLLAIALLVAACAGANDGAASIPPSGLGLVGPSGGRGTEEPLATENLASHVPAPDPPAAPALAVTVTKAPGSVAQGATAGVHRGDQLEPGREDRRASGTRDGDPALLHRLTKRLEHVARELGQLVEEQDALISERAPITPEVVRGRVT